MSGFSTMTSQRYGAPSPGEAYSSSRPTSRPSRQHGASAARSSASVDAGDSIGRSVEAVERAVGNIAALRENRDYYRGLAIELRRAFDDEKEHAKVFAQQLADADRARRADRERAERAERRLEQAAHTVHELERQLAILRAKADRLAQTVNLLTPGERGRDAIGGDLADLLAA